MELSRGEKVSNHSHARNHDVSVKSVEKLGATRIRLTLEFDAETVKSHLKATTNQFAHGASLPGFRPGKAPLTMIKERYRDEIRHKVIRHLVDAGVHQALTEKKLFPIAEPLVDFGKDVLQDDAKPFEFTVEFEVRPEIELRHYKDVPLKSGPPETSEKEVSDTLDHLRERFSSLEPLEATVPEKGSFAVVEIGYTLVETPEKNHAASAFTLKLGAGDLLPELEARLLEMKVGEERRVRARFPDSHEDKSLAGKEADFDCKLLELKKKTLPELDDAFAGQVREGSSLEALTQEVRDSLTQSKKDEFAKSQRNEIVKYLLEKNHFEAPRSLVEEQFQKLLQYMKEDLKKKGMSVDALSAEDMGQVRKQAEQMVKSSLLLNEVATKEKISLDETKLTEKIAAIAERINRSAEDTKKFLEGKGMLAHIKDEVLTDQVFEFLIQNGSRS